VLVADVDDIAAEETVRLVGLAGGRGRAAHCVVADAGDVETLARTAEEWFGAPPGLVINNAGIGTGGQPIGADLMSDWERTLAVNLWGVIHGCRTFAPRMRAAGRGGIINIASAASFGAAPRMAAYNVSKAGVLALSETLAAELSGTGVTVTVVCPTFVKTNIIHADAIDAALLALGEQAMARFGWAPERVARVCLDAHARGRMHVLPQLDSRALWAAKRLAPATFTRVIGRLARFAPESAGTAGAASAIAVGTGAGPAARLTSDPAPVTPAPARSAPASAKPASTERAASTSAR
jgi:short-subunit dehydrogenase